MSKIDTIVFDLGGVLIDWNPRYLYRKIFDSEDKVEWFIKDICTGEWNDEQDAGRPFAEATALLIEKHPDYAHEILAYHHRWVEMLGGAIPGTVDILRYFVDNPSYRVYALTNWSAETYPIAKDLFDFLGWFDGVLVSGKEKTRKPFPDIYEKLFQRFRIIPEQALFIDDNLKNIEGGKSAGLHTLPFTSSEKLRADLHALGLIN